MLLRPVTVVVFGFLLAFIPAPSQASVLLAEYSGSYAILALDPASDPVASLRLTLGPQFADCDAGGCLHLAVLEGLTTESAGTEYALPHAEEAAAMLFNGADDVFSFSLNFGPVYSSGTSGGGVGIYDSVLAGNYSPFFVDSITLTIYQLLFSQMTTPFGPAAEARLEYTLSVLGRVVEFDESVSPSEQAPSSLLATPEPATWLLLWLGIAGVRSLSRKP